MRYSILYIITLFQILGCNKSKDFDCLKNTGKINKETRYQQPISKILLQDGINLVFIVGDSLKIEVEAGKNLLPKIKTTIIGDSLVIEDQNYCNWVRSFEKDINIYITGFQNIKLYNKGYGKVNGIFKGNELFIRTWSNETMDIEVFADKFWLESFKLGNINLDGNIRNALIFRHETGILRMNSEMTCENLIYHDHGQGTSYLKADSSADVVLFSTGDVVFNTKPPKFTLKILSTGKIL